MAEKAESFDVLDELKELERAVRARALTKMLATLKSKAREVLELKEYVNAVLSELGLDEKDAKRLIDWVNSLEEVKLNDNDRESLRKNAKNDVRNERKAAEKKITEAPSYPLTTGFVQTTGISTVPAYAKWEKINNVASYMSSIDSVKPGSVYASIDLGAKTSTTAYTVSLSSGSKSISIPL